MSRLRLRVAPTPFCSTSTGECTTKYIIISTRTYVHVGAMWSGGGGGGGAGKRNTYAQTSGSLVKDQRSLKLPRKRTAYL